MLSKIEKLMLKDIERDNAMTDLGYATRRSNKSRYLYPWSPLFPLTNHRLGSWINDRWGKRHNKNPFRFLLKAIYHLGRFLSVVIHKTAIEEESIIDESIFISPKGGIILGANSIGHGCTIHHNVTIGFGFGSGRKMQRPNIGQDVWIGPGAIIYGNIKVGDGAVICPDTVVSRTVPPRCMISGNPSRIFQKDINSMRLLNSTSVKAPLAVNCDTSEA